MGGSGSLDHPVYQQLWDCRSSRQFYQQYLFGLFGLTAYIFPILLFAGTAFIIANQENKKAVRKAAAAGVLFVFVCMFLELISGSADTKSPLDSYVWSAAASLEEDCSEGF